jgi:hypothetical protein
MLEPIDDEVIQAHLKGQQTIGLYQLLPIENTIKWAVVDIDVNKRIWSKKDFNVEDWESRLFEQAERVKRLFTEKNIPSYIEHSGNKGYHIWVFFDIPVKADIVKTGMNQLFNSMEKVDEDIDWELFPKQSAVSEDDFGNLVKGPNGFHHKSKKYSKFLDEITLDTIKYANANFFVKKERPYLNILNRCSAIKNTWDLCLKNREAPNFFREVVAYLFLNAGDEAEEYLIQEFFSKLENYDDKKTRRHLTIMKNKIRGEAQETGYLPILCESLQDAKYGNICPGRCSAIGAAKSPIAFYKWAVSETKTQTDVEGAVINKLDFIFKANNAYFERIPSRVVGEPPAIKQLSNFTIDLDEVRTIVDGMDTTVTFYGEIKTQQNKIEPFEIAAEDYASTERFKAAVLKTIPPDSLLALDIAAIQCGIQKYSNTKAITILKSFGFDTDIDSKQYPTAYRTPSVIVTAEGVKPNNDVIVSLDGEQFAESLDLQILTDTQFSTVKKHMRDDLLNLADFEIAHGALAYTFMPIVFPFLKEAGDFSRFLLFVRGETGRGKSYLMGAFQHFYGIFKNVPTWSSTPNSLGKIGYYYKDAMYLVDDFKKSVFTSPSAYTSALTMLQNFADNTARSRMNRNQNVGTTYIIRGWLSVTGEDTPYGEASNLARLVSLNYNSPKREIARGQKVQKFKKLYSGVTARFIHRIFNTPVARIEKIYYDALDEFYKLIEGQPNDIRVARNVALLYTSYKFISDELWSTREAKVNQDKFKELFKEKIVSIVEEAASELSSERLLSVIRELMASDRIRLQTNAQNDVEKDNRTPVVGFWTKNESKDFNTPHFVSGLLFNEVNKFLRQSEEPLAHTPKAILAEMFEAKLIYDANKVRTMNGKSVRCFTLKPELLT